MARIILSFIGIILVVLLSSITAISGIFIMISSLITGHEGFLQGLQLFFLGFISFTATAIAYSAMKILKNTEIIANALADTLDEMNNQKYQSNPLQSLFNGGMGIPGFPDIPTAGTIRMAKMDKDGNITPIGEKEFKTHEEFLKYRDDLINNAIQGKDGKKTVNEMTLEELESELVTALADQDYDLCAAIRDAIKDKKAQN